MKIKAFQAIRPRADLAARVASVPYDTVDTDEARELAGDNALSFLHVIRPEIDFPAGVDLYSPRIYARAAANYRSLIQRGALVREAQPSLYLYRQRMGEHAQTGVVCCCHIDDYQAKRIRRHEEVRSAKLADRTALIDAMDAQAGPVFLTYRDRAPIDALVEALQAETPLFDFTAEDGVDHTVWRVAGDHALARQVEGIPVSYVADGHHRAASAVHVGLKRRKAQGAAGIQGEFNWFMAALFPAGQLRILPYNRCVRDLNGLAARDVLRAVRACCTVVDDAAPAPRERGWTHMYLDGAWYGVKLPHRPDDPARSLDADTLHQCILHPILGIGDPKSDARIDFVGGIRGTAELTRRVDSGGAAVAFALYPVAIEDVMALADADATMPPKSTWFEPKLRSGLLIHALGDG